MNYDVYLCSYNAEYYIRSVIYALFKQTIPPERVFVYDDGSKDSTIEKLLIMRKQFPNLHVFIEESEHEYDTSRLPKNINKMLDINDNWIMILSDDVILPNTYVEQLTAEISRNPRIGVISGNELTFTSNADMPRGSGRLINPRILRLTNYRFIENLSWETLCVLIAQFLGYETICKNEIKYTHTRINGSMHGYRNYGKTMKQSGYSLLFVLIRIIKNIFDCHEFKPSLSMKILYQYLVTPNPQLPNGLLKFIRERERKRILRFFE